MLEAVEKLELLKKKKEDAEKSKDIMTASDLLYYAIPEQKSRIERLKKAQQEDEPDTRAKKQGHALHIKVETDTESSDNSEDQQEKVDGSDAGSDGQDLYE